MNKTAAQRNYHPSTRVQLAAIVSAILLTLGLVTPAAAAPSPADAPAGLQTFTIDKFPYNVTGTSPGGGAAQLDPQNTADAFQFTMPHDSTELLASTPMCTGEQGLQLTVANADTGATVLSGEHNCSNVHRIAAPAGKYTLTISGQGIKKAIPYRLLLRVLPPAVPVDLNGGKIPQDTPTPGAGVLENALSVDQFLVEVPDFQGSVWFRPWQTLRNDVHIALVPADGSGSGRAVSATDSLPVKPGRQRLLIGTGLALSYATAKAGPYEVELSLDVYERFQIPSLPFTVGPALGPTAGDNRYGTEVETYSLPRSRAQAIGLRMANCEDPTARFLVRSGSMGAGFEMDCSGKDVAVLTADSSELVVRALKPRTGRFSLTIDSAPAGLIELPGIESKVSPNKPRAGAGIFADGNSSQDYFVRMPAGVTKLYLTATQCKDSVPLVLKTADSAGKVTERPFRCGTWAVVDAQNVLGVYDMIARFTVAPARTADGTPAPGTNLKYSFEAGVPSVHTITGVRIPATIWPGFAVGIGRLENGLAVDRYVISGKDLPANVDWAPYFMINECSVSNARLRYKVLSAGTEVQSGKAVCGAKVQLPTTLSRTEDFTIEFETDETNRYFGSYWLRVWPTLRHPYLSVKTNVTQAKIDQPIDVEVTLHEEDGPFGYKATKLTSGYTLRGSGVGSCTLTQCRAGDPGPYTIYATLDAALGLGLISGEATVQIAYRDIADVAVHPPGYGYDHDQQRVIVEFGVRNLGSTPANHVEFVGVVYDAATDTLGPPVGIAGNVCKHPALFPGQTLTCRITLPPNHSRNIVAFGRVKTATKEALYTNNALSLAFELPRLPGQPGLN